MKRHAEEKCCCVPERSFTLHIPHILYMAEMTVKDLCKYDFKSPGSETGQLERKIKENLMVVIDKAILAEFRTLWLHRVH